MSNRSTGLSKAYGDGVESEDEKKYVLGQIQRLNDALILREQNTIVSNGMKFTQAGANGEPMRGRGQTQL